MTTSTLVIANRNSELWATVLVTLSSLFYGFLGYFGASLLNLHLPIASMLFWRFMVASLWMLPAVIKKNRHTAPDSKSPTRAMLLLMLSSLAYCTACTFYFMASLRTGTGIAMVIYFAYPLFVVVMVMIQRRQWVDRNTFLSLLILVAGLYLLKDGAQETASKLGICFALLSALFFAIYVFISKSISTKLSSQLLTFVLCLNNATLFLVYALASHSFVVPTSMTMWLFACCLGVIATAVPIQLMLEGLKTISASKASILSALEPVVTLFVGMLLLHEQVTNTQMGGAFVVLLSAIFIQFATQKTR